MLLLALLSAGPAGGVRWPDAPPAPPRPPVLTASDAVRRAIASETVPGWRRGGNGGRGDGDGAAFRNKGTEAGHFHRHCRRRPAAAAATAGC